MGWFSVEQRAKRRSDRLARRMALLCQSCGGSGLVLDEEASMAQSQVSGQGGGLYYPCPDCSGTGRTSD